MRKSDVKKLNVGQFLYHDLSEKYVQITDISWRSSQANKDDVSEVVIQTKDFSQRCEWTINEDQLERWTLAPDDFDPIAYVKECEAVKFCKCCGCSDEEGWSLDENGVCEYCNKHKALIKTSIRKSAYVDLGEFGVYGKEGDYMELTEWTNGEGYDLCVNRTGKETNHLITADELQALFNLAIAIGFKLDDYSKI